MQTCGPRCLSAAAPGRARARCGVRWRARRQCVPLMHGGATLAQIRRPRLGPRPVGAAPLSAQKRRVRIRALRSPLVERQIQWLLSWIQQVLDDQRNRADQMCMDSCSCSACIRRIPAPLQCRQSRLGIPHWASIARVEVKQGEEHQRRRRMCTWAKGKVQRVEAFNVNVWPVFEVATARRSTERTQLASSQTQSRELSWLHRRHKAERSCTAHCHASMTGRRGNRARTCSQSGICRFASESRRS